METNLETTDTNPLTLINLALEKGVDIDKLTRLFDLQERWEKKEAEKSFLAAFSNFQKACPEIKKTKTVDFSTSKGKVNYSYAPLSEITKQIKKALTSNFMSYRWEFGEKDEKIECTCIVSHADGHSKQSTFSAPKDATGSKNTIQQIGSTHTYLQRYTLIGALGISSADSDIDARVKPKAQPKKKLTDTEQKILSMYQIKFEALKTTEEVQSWSKDLLEEAEADGAPMVELKKFARKYYDDLKLVEKKESMKSNKDLGTTETPDLP